MRASPELTAPSLEPGLILVLMWPFRRASIPTYEVENIVCEGTTVRGDLRGPGAGFRTDGTVIGSI